MNDEKTRFINSVSDLKVKEKVTQTITEDRNSLKDQVAE